MDEERIIVEVEKHPIIYDTTDPFYKDNLRKEKAWNEIAEAVGSDADACKARWRSLRDSFVKNRKKCGTGTAKEWKYGDAMTFLLPHIQPKSSKGNLNHSQNDEERSSTPQSLSGGEDSSRSRTLRASRRNRSVSPAPTTSAPSTSRSRSPRNRNSTPAAAAQETRSSKRPPRTDTDIEERLMTLLEQPEPKPRMPQGDLDEAYHFALSIVPTLHRLNQDSRQQAKIEILTLLHNLERSQVPHVTVELQPVTEDFKIKEEEEPVTQNNWQIDREG